MDLTPDINAVCEGTNISAILTPCTGGDRTDVLEFRTCAGTDCSDWSAYNNNDEISTTGLSFVEIRTKRLGGTCDDSDYSAVAWSVLQLPGPPTANDVTVCYDGTPYTGTATGQTGEEVVWYDEAAGGSPASAPSGTEPGTYTAYAAAKNRVTGCESTERTLLAFSGENTALKQEQKPVNKNEY
jgi:hypothetical protein